MHRKPAGYTQVSNLDAIITLKISSSSSTFIEGNKDMDSTSRDKKILSKTKGGTNLLDASQHPTVLNCIFARVTAHVWLDDQRKGLCIKQSRRTSEIRINNK